MNFFEALSKCSKNENIYIIRKIDINKSLNYQEDYFSPINELLSLNLFQLKRNNMFFELYPKISDVFLEDDWEVKEKASKTEPINLEVGCYYETKGGSVVFIKDKHPNFYFCEFKHFYGYFKNLDTQWYLQDGYFVGNGPASHRIEGKLSDQKWPWVEELKKDYEKAYKE